MTMIRQLGGNHQQREALAGEFVQQSVDFRLRFHARLQAHESWLREVDHRSAPAILPSRLAMIATLALWSSDLPALRRLFPGNRKRTGDTPSA